MENSSEQSKMEQKPSQGRPKGGLITMPFIIANEAFEKVASYGLLPNMILYLMNEYNIGAVKGTNILFFWSAATNFMPIVGAFLSDSYLSRFLTIGFGSIFSFLGMVVLWLTAMIPQAKPPPCDLLSGQSCKSPTQVQYWVLFASFALMSIGAGGIRPCSLAFGADQLDKRDNPKNERVLESYFSWYYAAATSSVLVALTGIVYIQDHIGWKVGFGVPAILMFFSALLFFLASPIYVKMKASKSLLTGFAQVAVVAYKNRRLALPPQDSSGWYHHRKDSELKVPTNKLRFLNKACIIRKPEDITPDGIALNPWSICTVEQVEALKALLKVTPIWSSGIMMTINISQPSFPVLQAKSLDRHLTSSFQIPAGSFGMFTIIALTLWIVLYDRVILPVASKIKGKPVYLGVQLRMGIGLFFSCLAMVVSALVENVRRRKAIKQGFLNNAGGLVDMSAMWLVPQHCLNGLAEAFNAIGQTEFYYTEFPKSMSSIASSLFLLGMAVANLLATAILSTVNDLTKKGGKESWVSNNINRGQYENYYWILAILSSINLLYYIVCSLAYGPCVDQRIKVRDEGKELKEEEISKQ
ncbi:protein NRT1/ PTR FAMILY 1.2-like [Cornus florida]|uniref:protein NRT1/ PTR FAMILY 1.2-like n=1 Tax=Cornus florida TaxID=4283 RepID=UPI002896D6D8|nr:protein NRT1/ PTR FAMILY 1.2-like [Cornus florida]